MDRAKNEAEGIKMTDLIIIGVGLALCCCYSCGPAWPEGHGDRAGKYGRHLPQLGCIPTKALLRSSEIANLLNHAGDFGFEIKGFSFDLKKIVERSRKVANQLSTGVKFLMKKNKIEVVDGTPSCSVRVKIEVTAKMVRNRTHGQEYHHRYRRTRTCAARAGARCKLVWTYREAMVPETMPKSLLVVGSGAIGIEFASFYRTLGVEVTVVEVMDRILPVEDEEVSGLR